MPRNVAPTLLYEDTRYLKKAATTAELLGPRGVHSCAQRMRTAHDMTHTISTKAADVEVQRGVCTTVSAPHKWHRMALRQCYV